jgi:hypothetical protein
MAAPKKKPTINASDIVVDSRRLENVLADLAEQIKANDARHANRVAQFEERSAQLEERSARNEELIAIALQTIAAVTQDLRALAQRTDDRLVSLEKAIAAE